MEIVIVGGGIAGIILASLILRFGFDIDVTKAFRGSSRQPKKSIVQKDVQRPRIRNDYSKEQKALIKQENSDGSNSNNHSSAQPGR